MTTYVLKEETALAVRSGPVTIHFDRVPHDARIIAFDTSGQETQLVKRLGSGVAILPNVDQDLTVGIESGMNSFERGTSVTLRLEIDSGFGREADEIHFHSPLDISGDFHHSLFSISPDAEMLRVALVEDVRTSSAVLSDLAEAARVAAVRLSHDSTLKSAIDDIHIVVDGSASFKRAGEAGLHEVVEILIGVGQAIVGMESMTFSIADRAPVPIRIADTESAIDDIMRAFAGYPLKSAFNPASALVRRAPGTRAFVVTDAYDRTLSAADSAEGQLPVHQVLLTPAAAGSDSFADATVIAETAIAGAVPLEDQSRSAELDGLVHSLLAATGTLATEERSRR